MYDGREYAGLLTDGEICRWIAHVSAGQTYAKPMDESKGQNVSLANLQNHTVIPDDLLESTVGGILRYEKSRVRTKFICRDAAIFEAEEIFRSSASNCPWRIAAILITETSDPREKLLGIITPSDILDGFMQEHF